MSEVPLSGIFESASEGLNISSGTHTGLSTHHGVSEEQRGPFNGRVGTQVVDEGITYGSQQRLRSGSRESTTIEIHDDSNN